MTFASQVSGSGAVSQNTSVVPSDGNKPRPEFQEESVSRTVLEGWLDGLRVQKDIASDLFRDKRYSLRCHECDHVREITKDEFAEYLATGWPKHCGRTMELESEPR